MGLLPKIGVYAKTYWQPALLDQEGFYWVNTVEDDLSLYDYLVVSLPQPSMDFSVDVLSREAVKISNLATRAMALGVKPIFISTPEVFPNGNIYMENDRAYPKNHYGLTNLIGEYLVSQVGGNILRIGTVFGLGVATAPWLMLEGAKPERAFSLDPCSWTYLPNLAWAITNNKYRIRHVVCDLKISPYEMASIFAPISEVEASPWITNEGSPSLLGSLISELEIQYCAADLIELWVENKRERLIPL